MIDAEVLAIEEINAGRGACWAVTVEAVIADGRSDPQTFAQEARRLIDDGEGERDLRLLDLARAAGASRRWSRRATTCCSSRRNYEGMDISPSIVCTGPIPNQQVIPAVNWCFETLRPGSSSWSARRTCGRTRSNAIIKDQLKAMGAEVAGEKYVALGRRRGCPR